MAWPGSHERRALTYAIFTIGTREFTIGSRQTGILSPVNTTLRHTLSSTGSLTMKNDKEIVRIDLTPEQKQLVKKEIGKEGDSVELTVKELEERIAPKAII
jgi:hypothetical protein